MNRKELLAVLRAFSEVVQSSWPTLNPGLVERSQAWARLGDKELQQDLQRCVSETDLRSQVRVFWKLLPDFAYGGCNDHFARDAGFNRAADLVGKNDFSSGVSWINQAAKYRKDDQKVVADGQPLLDIIERQTSASGTTWLRTGKAPIRPEGGAAIGILGMYELIDRDTASRVLREQELKKLS